jgi:acetylglutamate kinase
MSEARHLMTKLLRQIGGRKEVDQYLRHYGGVESQKFAVIELGADVLGPPEGPELDILATSLAFLQQVGLLPIVVHGAAPRVAGELVAAGFDEAFDALPHGALAVLRRVMQEDNLALVDALERHGAKARPIASGVFEAVPRAQSSWRGDTTGVDGTAISAAQRAGQLPVLAALGSTSTGQSLYLDVDDAAEALARKLEPHKLIVLRGAGGWSDVDGRAISAINISEDYDRLANGRLDAEEQMRLTRIDVLLDELPDNTSVSITSPDHLARELFTHRGAGTLIQHGERVLRFERFEELDTERLRALLETCFGRRLAPRYFEEKTCYRAYVSEAYRATAILTQEAGMPYLDKFAVTTKAQGEGLGGSVWERMRTENPKLFWRSQSQNEVNGWYFQQSDGSFKTPQWTVFWYGMSDFDEVRRAVETALALPATLRHHGTGDG